MLEAVGSNNPDYNFECVVYSYASFGEELDWVRDMNVNADAGGGGCIVVQQPGRRYLDFLAMLQPFLLNNHYQYIALVLDDVDASSLDYIAFMREMEHNELKVASPSVMGATHWITRPVDLDPAKPCNIGRSTNFIEYFAMFFSYDSWKCMYKLVDQDYPSTWGLDLWMYSYCSTKVEGFKMGVFDSWVVSHVQSDTVPKAEGAIINGVSKGELMAQQEAKWAERGDPLVRANMKNLGALIALNCTASD